jgi:glycosyltransferase involved in cell wall biosynthesis
MYRAARMKEWPTLRSPSAAHACTKIANAHGAATLETASLGRRSAASPEAVAIVVVPRDRLSTFPMCLDALYANTGTRFRILVVAGAVDDETREHLDRLKATKSNLSYVLEDRLLTQAKARNLGLSHCSERFVVLLENDVVVHENWLPPMLECMRDEQAAVVTPLLWWYRGLHAAGGSFELLDDGETLVLSHSISYSQIRRRRVDYPENHCLLIDREQLPEFPFDDVEPFDVDLGLTLRDLGLTAFLEPVSEATYAAPPPIEIRDIPLFKLRWGWPAWEDANRRFQEKWGLRYDRSRKRASYRRQQLKFALVSRYPNHINIRITNFVFLLTNNLQALLSRRRLPRSPTKPWSR